MPAEPAKVLCQACQRAYRWTEQYAGKKVKCKCGEVMRFPDQPPVAAEADIYELNLDSEPVARQAAQPAPGQLRASTPAPAPSSGKSSAAVPLAGDEGEHFGGLDALAAPDDGAPILPDLAAAATAPVCPGCGKAVKAEAVICVGCGYNLRDGKQLKTELGVAAVKGQGGKPRGGARFASEPVYEGFFGRLSRSWEYSKIAYGIIWDFKRLLFFPIMSGTACFLVLLSFALPLFLTDLHNVVFTSSSSTTPHVAAHAPAAPAPALDAGDAPADAVATPEVATSDAAPPDLAAAPAAQAGATEEDAGGFEESFDDAAADEGEYGLSPVGMVFTFAFYFANYFVIAFFNTGLIACAMKVASGDKPTIGYGMSIAFKRLPQIAAWACLSAVIGLLLKLIESSSEKVGKFIAMVMGAAWTILTYFVVPVLAVEGIGPFQAIKKSAVVLKEVWGEGVLGNFSLGLLGFLIALPVYLLIGVMFFFALTSGNTALLVVAVIASVMLLVVLAAASSAADMVFKALLYNYATGRDMPGDVDQAVLAGAFGSKG